MYKYAIVVCMFFCSKITFASGTDTIHVRVKIAFIDSVDNVPNSHFYEANYLMLGLLQDGKTIECSSKIVFKSSIDERRKVVIGSVYDIDLVRSSAQFEKSETEKEIEKLPSHCFTFCLRESDKYLYSLIGHKPHSTKK